MAGSGYSEGNSGDPNQTDTSNGNGDWWNQNAPPTAPGAFVPGKTFVNTSPTPASRPTGIPDPAHPGYDTGGYLLNSTFDPNAGPFGHVTPNAPPPAPTPDQQTWGGPVAPFQYNPQGSGYPSFTPPPLPDALQHEFQLPSAADLENTPGYFERFKTGQLARERGAAAHGTILNGGTQEALTRYGQDYASNEYSNLAQQKLGERQQQSQDYLNLAYGPAWQTNQAAVNQYGTLYNQYRNLNADNRSAQNSYWQQQMDLLNAGLKAASAGSPGSTGGQG